MKEYKINKNTAFRLFFSVSANVWKKKNVFMDFSPIPLAHDVNVWTSFREKERREREYMILFVVVILHLFTIVHDI